MAGELVPGAAAPGASGGGWQCLHCRGQLRSCDLGFRCHGCGKFYPLVAGVPLLVKEPADYLRSERASLIQVAREGRQRTDLLTQLEPYTGLSETALQRHRDVLAAEVAQAESLLALLGSGPMLQGLADDARAVQARRPGWSFDLLVPYLIRDWTNTSELQLTSESIGAALSHSCPDPRGKSIAFAGCGAGGLLASVSADFARIVGFDLTLPILAAARRLLDGGTLDLPLAHILNASGLISLRRHGSRTVTPHVEFVAMDALETAFADNSMDCIVTVFLTDILADPRALAQEVHRVLVKNGVWINYGPSGNNLKSLWRFDQTGAADFFTTAGFAVSMTKAERRTNLDITAACPSTSFRNTMCYMTVVWKTSGVEGRPVATTPGADDLWRIIPQHFPGARLVHCLNAGDGSEILLQHERNPERAENWKLGGNSARMMLLVDGKRTVGEIAGILSRGKPSQPVDDIRRAFARFFQQGLLHWRDRPL